MSGQNRPASSRRWIGIAALALTAATIVATVAFLLGRDTPRGTQTANTPKPGPVDPDGRTTGSRENTQQGASATGTINDSTQPAPQAHVNAPSGTVTPPRTYEQVKQSRLQGDQRTVHVPPSGDHTPSDPDFYASPSLAATPLESESIADVPVYLVAGRTRLDLEDPAAHHEADNPPSSLQPGDWIVVLPGSTAEITIAGGFGEITATIPGGSVVAFQSPPEDSLEHNLLAVIKQGSVILSKSGPDAPAVALYYQSRLASLRALGRPSKTATLKSGDFQLGIRAIVREGEPPGLELRTNPEIPSPDPGLWEDFDLAFPRHPLPDPRFVHRLMELAENTGSSDSELAELAENALQLLASLD